MTQASLSRELREEELQPSIHDYLLRPCFAVAASLLDITFLRLLLAAILLPVYIYLQALAALPSLLKNGPRLRSSRARARLLDSADSYRRFESELAEQQLDGTFRFQPSQLLRGEQARGWAEDLDWRPRMKEFEVLGAMVNVVHELPPMTRVGSGKKVLLLHGNPSWSFMWRNIIPGLLADGHEVFALDWIGHGASDKPISGASITFELHVHTLMRCIEHFQLSGCYIAAHDWGGCIALSTVPRLPPSSAISGLFLLNSFFPPRPSDIATHYYLLYLIWFFSTGILDGYLPESVVMRYMSPAVTSTIVTGYSAPYFVGPSSRASVSRFSHMVPGIPDPVLSLRPTTAWRLVEGLLSPTRFTNVNAQARLARSDLIVRRWWQDQEAEKSRDGPKVGIAFGRDDPLLKDCKEVLTDTIALSLRQDTNLPAAGSWIDHAGHYPVEDRPELVTELLCAFIDTVEIQAYNNHL